MPSASALIYTAVQLNSLLVNSLSLLLHTRTSHTQ